MLMLRAPLRGLPVRLKRSSTSTWPKALKRRSTQPLPTNGETLTLDFTQNVPGTPNINYNTAYTILSIFFDFGNEGFMRGPPTISTTTSPSTGNPSSVGMTATEKALLYPTISPAGQPVFVQCIAPVDFTLTNLSGQVVMNQVITGSGALELPRLAPGVYVYRLGLKRRSWSSSLSDSRGPVSPTGLQHLEPRSSSIPMRSGLHQ